MHQLRIADSIQPGRSANAYNPETAKITLLQLSAGVSKIQPALNRFLRRAIQLRLCAAITFRELQYLLAPFETLVSSFCPWHRSIPLLKKDEVYGLILRPDSSSLILHPSSFILTSLFLTAAFLPH